MKKVDLTKKKIGSLTVIAELSKRDKWGGRQWLCKCDCGKKAIVTTSNLGAGGVRSCGCSKKRVKAQCAYCKKEMQIPLSKSKGNVFCDQICYHNYRRNAVETVCDYCGAKIEKPLYAFNGYKRHFCGRKCRGLWNRKEVKTICAYCGDSITKSRWEIKKNKPSFCSQRCYYEWVKKTSSRSGENNPAWKGGVSFEIYCAVWKLEEFKKEILERDHYKCQNPDCRHTSDRLTRHHIDYDKKNCNPNNLICLCISCNARANTDREWHTAWYQAILRKRGI